MIRSLDAFKKKSMALYELGLEFRMQTVKFLERLEFLNCFKLFH